MAATTVKSENITNLEASPQVVLHKKKGKLISIIDQDAIATTSIDEVGDVMLFCPIPSNATILDLLYVNDDLDTNATETLAVNVGLFYSGIGGDQKETGKTSGLVIDADCFGTAQLFGNDPVLGWTSARFEADDIVDVKKEAWEVAGLTADPGGTFYVGLTVTAVSATPAAGDVVMRVDYI